MRKKELLLAKENQTTIYVWKMNMPLGRIGHASMRTYVGGQDNQGYYMSFWPEEKSKQQFSLSGVNSHLVKRLEDDIRNEENKNADVIVHLFSLDVNAMNKAYENFRSGNKPNWSTFGSAYFRDASARNCSGVVGYLLYQGGIQNLVIDPHFDFSQGTGTMENAIRGATIPATLGAVTLGAKITANLPAEKIAATAKLTVFATATEFAKNASLTPDDIAAIATTAYAVEHKKYEFSQGNIDSQEMEYKLDTKKMCTII